MILMNLAFLPLIQAFGEIKKMHWIRYSVKFLPKLSKIKGNKIFLKGGEVDVIDFSLLITTLLILMTQ